MTQRAKHIIQQWLQEWVIGLNLCPFARYPYEQNKVRIVVTEATDEEAIFIAVLQEMNHLIQTDADQLETTVIVIEQSLQEFEDYLQILDTLEAVLPQTGLQGILQIASFHPDYCFDGVDADDVSNYTNRSPYPLFHLIREDSLEQALEHIQTPEAIPQNNINLMQQLGLTEVKRRLQVIAECND